MTTLRPFLFAGLFLFASARLGEAREGKVTRINKGHLIALLEKTPTRTKVNCRGWKSLAKIIREIKTTQRMYRGDGKCQASQGARQCEIYFQDQRSYWSGGETIWLMRFRLERSESQGVRELKCFVAAG